MEQVFFNVSIKRLEPIIKRWVKEVYSELNQPKNDSHKQFDRFLTIDEAAKLLCLSKPTIYCKVSKGELPYMKRSKRLYFSQIELIEYIKNGKRKSNSEIQNEVDNILRNHKK